MLTNDEYENGVFGLYFAIDHQRVQLHHLEVGGAEEPRRQLPSQLLGPVLESNLRAY